MPLRTLHTRKRYFCVCSTLSNRCGFTLIAFCYNAGALYTSQRFYDQRLSDSIVFFNIEASCNPSSDSFTDNVWALGMVPVLGLQALPNVSLTLWLVMIILTADQSEYLPVGILRGGSVAFWPQQQQYRQQHRQQRHQQHSHHQQRPNGCVAAAVPLVTYSGVVGDPDRQRHSPATTHTLFWGWQYGCYACVTWGLV